MAGNLSFNISKDLRRHAELVDLRPDFTILDTDDQIRLLKQIIQAENIDEKDGRRARWPVSSTAGKTAAGDQTTCPTANPVFCQWAGRQDLPQYQQRLKILNATDFGDLLLECLRLFRENDAVLVEYQNKFKHILVDEYQDTNAVQYLWLRLLAQAHNNICCVGDDDQSIYGWRGAEVDNILRFERDFAGAQVIRLERNYRSTPHILAAASGLIAPMRDALAKSFGPT